MYCKIFLSEIVFTETISVKMLSGESIFGPEDWESQSVVTSAVQLWELEVTAVLVVAAEGQTSLVKRQLTEQQHNIMLPKNYSLRKILVLFSFFEIYCTRVGNSERFSQGKPRVFVKNSL